MKSRVKPGLAIVVVLFWFGFGQLTAQHKLDRQDFSAGERMLKDGDLNGAYRMFDAAVKGDPTNAKYVKKRAEVGAILCSLNVEQAKSIAAQDPVLAYDFVQKALSFNHLDGPARDEAETLERRADAARLALKEAHSSVHNGDAARAKALLDSVAVFRRWHLDSGGLPSFDSVTSELDGLNQALRVRDLVKAGSVQQAVDLLLTLRRGDEGSFAAQSLAETRRELVHSLVEDARAKRQDNIAELSQLAPLFATAFRLDPSDVNLNKLSLETSGAYLSLLSKAAHPQFKNQQSEARYRLALSNAISEMFGSRYISSPPDNKGAYPALGVRIQIIDPKSCLAANERQKLDDEVMRALSPVSRRETTSWDLEVTIAEVSCSRTDIPRAAVQAGNSTYAAGKTQLSNPNYIQLQSALASAEANLNRTATAYQANPTILNAFLQSEAVQQVQQLRNRLANTPPYSNSEIVQAYQYEVFESSRSITFVARMAVQANPARFQYSVNNEITSTRADRQQGVSGVLPTDRSGARNVTPTLKPLTELTTESRKEFFEKAVNDAKSAVAGFYAFKASNDKELNGERIAAMLYFSDLSKGTEYEDDAEEIRSRFRKGIEKPETLLSVGAGIKLHVPEQTAVLTQPDEPVNAIEKRSLLKAYS